jgi:hypothetical protein
MGNTLSRRRMLGLVAITAGLVGCDAGRTGTPAAPGTASRVSAPPAAGVLGANLNQDLATRNFAELRAVSATWLRGFYLMQNADHGDVANQPEIRKLLTAAAQGYGTVLNLKFDYPQGLPVPGSSAMDTVAARVSRVLAVVMGKVDILVIGNEPFFESGKQDRVTTAINRFYETVTQYAVAYRSRSGGTNPKTEIYLGALTGLENPPPDELPQITRWLDFARNDTAIAGTDCHPHVASLADARRYPDYILPRLRPDQKFLATEFSLVRLYEQHLSDPVATPFTERYRIPRGRLVWQVVQDAIRNPFPQDKWNDFLSACPWFAGNSTFMSDAVRYFRNGGRCAVAGWGLAQDAGAVADFGPDKLPWVFNSLFCPHTVQQGTDGLPGQNVTWTEEFRTLQQG